MEQRSAKSHERGSGRSTVWRHTSASSGTFAHQSTVLLDTVAKRREITNKKSGIGHTQGYFPKHRSDGIPTFILYIYIYMYRHVEMCFDSSSRNCTESMHAGSQRALRFTSFAILLQFAQQVGRYWCIYVHNDKIQATLRDGLIHAPEQIEWTLRFKISTKNGWRHFNKHPKNMWAWTIR